MRMARAVWLCGISTIMAWSQIDISKLSSVSEWDNAFLTGVGTATSNGGVAYSVRHPELAAAGDEGDRYAWHTHYWLRAYGLMAQITGDTKYINWGMELIDTMFYKTDRARYNRGEMSIQTYDEAPRGILQRQWCRSHTSDSHCTGLTATDSNAIPLSWHRVLNGKSRVETLNDGQILQGMMRFLALVMTDNRFSSYKAKAEEFISRIEQIVDDRLPSYSEGDLYYPMYGGGSFYYIRNDASVGPFADLAWGDPKYAYYSNPVPFNHSATFAAALLLLDSINGHSKPEYRDIASKVLAYWQGYVRKIAFESDSAYLWDYELAVQASNGGVEDMGHGHVDMSFLTLAYKCGIGLTARDMQLLSNSYRHAYKGNGTFYEEMDATMDMASYDHFDMGYDWIDVMEFTGDSTLLSIARATLATNYTSAWARPLLMWANIIRWEHYFAGTLPTTISTTPSSERSARVLSTPARFRINGAHSSGTSGLTVERDHAGFYRLRVSTDNSGSGSTHR